MIFPCVLVNSVFFTYRFSIILLNEKCPNFRKFRNSLKTSKNVILKIMFGSCKNTPTILGGVHVPHMTMMPFMPFTSCSLVTGHRKSPHHESNKLRLARTRCIAACSSARCLTYGKGPSSKYIHSTLIQY